MLIWETNRVQNDSLSCSGYARCRMFRTAISSLQWERRDDHVDDDDDDDDQVSSTAAVATNSVQVDHHHHRRRRRRRREVRFGEGTNLVRTWIVTIGTKPTNKRWRRWGTNAYCGPYRQADSYRRRENGRLKWSVGQMNGQPFADDDDDQCRRCGWRATFPLERNKSRHGNACVPFFSLSEECLNQVSLPWCTNLSPPVQFSSVQLVSFTSLIIIFSFVINEQAHIQCVASSV